MTDFASISDIVTSMAAAGNSGAGGRFNFYKTSLTAVASNWYSGWAEGGAPAAGATPTTWATCTKSLLGAYNYNMVNASPATLRLLQASVTQANVGQGKWLVDRLGHMGGLSGTTTTAQSTGANGNTDAWAGTRCASDYSDVEWFLEWYTATGSTAVTATCAITYNDGTTGTTTVPIAASTPAYRMLPIQPPAGTVGKRIKSVDSVTIATTGTAGNFGVTALRRLACFTSSVANMECSKDFAAIAMPEIGDDACINAIYWTTTTTTGITHGVFTIGAK